METCAPWTESLRQALDRITTAERPPRVAIVGIGHPLRGDDAAGSLVAWQLRDMPGDHDRLLVIDGGPAPENVTGVLRHFKPNMVVLIDCAQMDAPPGTARWLDLTGTCGFGASSHTLPPGMLARYLAAELGCAIALLGIQPAQNEFGTPLSAPVERAVAEIASALGRLLG